jgi:pimeloyl-ACP methyl ester carboxylesterase
LFKKNVFLGLLLCSCLLLNKAVAFEIEQAKFESEGVMLSGTFVYDKRGVGQSKGDYEGNHSVSEMNLRLLAADARAAFLTLANHDKLKDVALGITGISQAGWIVLIAAQGLNKLDFIALWSAPVCKVSEEDIFSKFTNDNDSKGIPSYRSALEARRTPYVWPDFLGEDMNPSDALSTLSVPGLWVFGGNDGSIPVDLSIERLTALK